jgi:UDP-N-acetylmuramoyl-L-alanyl-D-glutamate--2,6-diaminopimelate ligase
MAAITAVSSVTGKSFEELAALVPKLTPIKGRMTVIDQGQPFELIVDYAHTPSSFETIFPPIRKRCTGRMFALFGSGGERDLTKRPLQGQIAAKFCDVIVLADEDPRGEDPVELLKMIAAGAEKEGKVMGENLFIIHDRPQAIRETFKMAGKGDIVLLLGKSHENSIIYKDHVMPYDEISEAKKALRSLSLSK